jgi:hypothetical protein
MPSTPLVAALDSLFGLPAHPLVVHAAVVLVPLAAVGTIAIAFWPAARRRIGWIVVALAVVGTVSCYLATKSGESLQENVPRTQAVVDHAAEGDGASFFGAAVVVGSGAVMVVDELARRRRAAGRPDDPRLRPLAIGAGALAIVLALLGGARIVQVGHSGATAVWKDPGGTNGVAPSSLTTLPAGRDGDADRD